MAYIFELESWNRRINLTGITDPREMALRHVGDTILVALHTPEGANTVLDIGTGAGVPGLVLKLIRQDLEVALVDAVRKKVSFLRYLIAKMGLSGVWAEHGRIGLDDVPIRRPREGFDLVISQAVGPLDRIVEIASGLVREGGLIVSLKGPKGIEELKAKEGWLTSKGWVARPVETRTPAAGYRRCLILVRKR
ncbi:16S rRNA (guanine(527)-N(7))-methyltransferase RsmG [Dissulfurimicrobium hydrothermale]|nr:16S rRNA (guanine(527)-N(7))-methyltransferase RsmG [Dissulfurimicrobium hydrothermale]UKL14353.1 16S rRNA (guanine(527)-N(7))-methyltransferase RsmG [Dissulfurimicrobium hydrothermale]